MSQQQRAPIPDYNGYADEILQTIKTRICGPCDDPQKARFTINYDNPLKCPCRCNRLEKLLENAKALKASAQKSS